MGVIDKKVFLTSIEQEAIDVLAKMPENYGEVIENDSKDCWAVQVLKRERHLLSEAELEKIVQFPTDF